MLTFTIITGLLFILGFILIRFYRWNGVGIVFLSLISVVVLVISLLFIFVSRYESSLFIEKYNVIKTSLEQNRKDLSDVERLEITKKVAEYNEKLAEYKYDYEHFFSICVKEEVAKLEYLK